MDPKDLPPLRAGLGRLAGQMVEPHVQEAAEHMKRRLIAMVATMVRRAGEHAYAYCVHSGRQTATAQDVEMSLKYQSRNFLQTLDDPETIRDIETAERELFVSESESEESEENPEDIESARKEIAMGAKVVEGTCGCVLCTDIRKAVETWDSWIPEDDLEKYLKSRVEVAIRATKDI